ncbi:hypothetical protein GCM10010251_59830 [Streptomyces aurantiogriseus]|uniref:Uncharacterized protein n=1 Tax=Streptomyces aurantiogriseus TaxID=66870 RepID=A0A918FFZ1_9ACTN|nr:hypothetical protein GCM10010251_59830 [Streptomyces aurantiogriseus]
MHEISSPPEVDHFGWVLETPWAGAGVPLTKRREDPLLVVLGERGCGKSDLFIQEAAVLKSEGHTVDLIDLKARGRFYEAGRAGQELGAVFERASEAEPGYVLLDSLDEGLDRLGVLHDVLVACLEELGRERRGRLRLRIACRSGRWPRGLERDLESLWGPGAVSVVGVTPLSRSDVEMAAACDGLDGRKVARRLQRKGAVALARSPITLKPLLEAEREGRGLPSTVADAYRLACRQLCSHGHRDRNPLGPDHLTALANRVAASLQFGHYEAVHDTQGAPKPDDVALHDLEGGNEPGPAGTPFHCGAAELLALVDSGLMVDVGLRRWAFAHGSYQEYLAAQFLARHGLRGEAQRQLLWIGDGASRHVVTRHREVAAWRVVDDPELFAEVLRDDPEVLLLADLTALRDEQRGDVVDRLFGLVRSDDTVRLDRWPLHRLNHRGLAAQLRPLLRPDTADPVFSAALSIARACRLPELNDQLLIVAEEQTVDSNLRQQAVEALSEDLEASHVTRLRALAEHNDADLGRVPVQELVPERVAWLRALAWRGDADLAAAALERLWPRHLRLPDFLDLIPPSGDPTRVRAAWLLIERAPHVLRPEDIDDAVVWATRVLGSRHPRAGLTPAGESQLSVQLPVRVLAGAIALLDEAADTDRAHRDRRLAQVAEALHTLAGRADFDDRYQLAQAVGEVLEDRPNLRRELSRCVLERADDPQIARLTSRPGSPALFATDEPVYWALQWPTLAPKARRHAALLVAESPDPADPDLPRALELREYDPELKAATARWDTRASKAEQQREHEEQLHRLAFDETRMRQALTAISASEGPPELLWQEIVGELYRTSDGSEAAAQHGWLGAVAAAPSFPPEGSELHHLLLDAATTVVRRSPLLSAGASDPVGTEWSQDVNTWSQAVTTLTALAVLNPSRLADALNDPRRAAAASIAAAASHCYTQDDIALRRTLINRCNNLAGRELPNLLTHALDGCSYSVLFSLTGIYERADATSAVDAVLTWAQAPAREVWQWNTVLTSLALAGNQQADEALGAIVADSELQRSAAESPRWICAATAVLASPRLHSLWPTLKNVLLQPGVLAALLDQFFATFDEWPPEVARLPEADLADLYAIVTDRVGPPADTRASAAGGVRDPNRELQNSLLALLMDKNTMAAARQLDALATRFPDLAYLRRHAKEVAYAAADRQAVSVAPSTLLRLAGDASIRIISDERHLLDIVVASLTRLEAVLRGPNGLVVALWNRQKWQVDHAEWWPCWEEDFSDLVAAFLRQDIGGHRVVINREVQIDRPGFPGKRTDIQIQATTPPTEGGDPLTVVIECKGCWNKDLATALADQLVGDYLRTPRTAGIYLIGYFDCDRWNHDERGKRHRAPRDHTILSVQHEQDARAQEQRDQHGAIVAARVLDCRLPGSGEPWRAEPGTPVV